MPATGFQLTAHRRFVRSAPRELICQATFGRQVGPYTLKLLYTLNGKCIAEISGKNHGTGEKRQSLDQRLHCRHVCWFSMLLELRGKMQNTEWYV